MKKDNNLDTDLNPLAFLMGGGEMGNLIRSIDWSQTSLGPVEEWPQSLRTTISICLASDLPICVIWGSELVQLYNDAYRVICGSKHPRSMGQNFPECWKEAWPVIGEAHNSAVVGNTAFLESQQIFLERHGYVEECFFTFSFSPIRDEAGRVGGLFHPVIEMTTQTLSDRRTRAVQDLTAQASSAKSIIDVLSLSAQTLASYKYDLPFVQFYTFDSSDNQAQLVDGSELTKNSDVSLSGPGPKGQEVFACALEEVIRSREALQIDLNSVVDLFSLGPYPEPPNRAILLPIILPGAIAPVAVMIAGISSRLKIDGAYRSFYDMLASAVVTGVANARAYEDERRRARVLSELDRAKTKFFSNVSHEFRTPLTLMLGPIEDVLTAPEVQLPALQRERLEIVQRNALRLQRLVNSLLEFSRIEAGRAKVTYEPTTLAEFTSELASNFRAACDQAGLKLSVDCPTLSELVFVDRTMWETIVLNLLSNAFKFTLEGEIAVSLRQVDHAVELRVRDTGIGVAAVDVPLLFERFHRVENALGRTDEGSGIGLSLVHELVKMHGGSISITSEIGQGTTFTVSIPMGYQHLPQEHIGNGSPAQPTTTANAFIEEALRWIPTEGQFPNNLPISQNDPNEPYASPEMLNDERPMILVADDNADMRQYIVRMLSTLYRTKAVPDGEAALAAARAHAPDLILTDVMMPRLDGFELLHALRQDSRTSDVPVIMLSARAGEESRIEGIREGADDYLVKPFSGRELLARVAAHLQMARMRRESIEAIRTSEGRFRALVSASSDAVYRMNADWTEMRHLQGREFIGDTHEPNQSWQEKYIHPDDQQHVSEVIRAAVQTKSIFELEHQVLRVDGTLGWTFSRAVPMMDKDGAVIEWFGMASNVTTRKLSQDALRQSEQKYRILFESMDEGYCVVEMVFDADMQATDYLFLEANPAFEKHTGLSNVQGKRMQEISSEHNAHWYEIFGRVAITGEPIAFVDNAKVLDGRWVDVYAFRLGEEGSHKVALLFNDITAQKRAEEERERLVARLKEEDQHKDEFLATLAHELRNPLAPIRSGLQIMRMPQIDAVATERIRTMMERQVGQMVHLIDDLLDLSRISHGKIDLRKNRIDLAEAIQQAIEASRPAIAQADHELLIKFPPDPIYVEADLTRLAQVFTNLLNNAAKFTDRGGRIRLTAQQNGAEAIVSVQDNGIGIPTEMLSHVFDMFAQIEGNLARSKGGLGIGLSLVKRLVEMHGGTIEVRSGGDSEGSEFLVHLPVASFVATPPAKHPDVGYPPVCQRILVVDDNVDAAEALAMLLAMMDNETLTAHDGLAALELAEKFKPDVIFLDIGMPKLNGYEVCGRIRQKPWGTDIVLVALTGWGQEDDKRRSLETGFDFHLTKPVLPDDIEKLLRGVASSRTPNNRGA